MFDIASFITALVTIGTLTAGAWLYSLWKRDASIADALLAVLSVTAALTYYAAAVEAGLRAHLFLFLIVAWSLMFSLHVMRRNWGQAEGSRYRAIRLNNQRHFRVQSAFVVVGLQGLLAAFVSVPTMIAIQGQQDLAALDFVAVPVWLIGMFFGVTGAWRLATFRRVPSNHDEILDSEVRRYQRYSNCLGECCIWWSFYLLAIPAGGWWTIFAPLLMTWLLLKEPGVALPERDIGHRRPGYQDSMHSASALITPLPRGAAQRIATEDVTQLRAVKREPSAADPSPATGRPRVFYDGGCPLCRREIDHYRRLDRLRRLEWIDIARQSDALRRNGLSYEQAMARFHVLDSDGKWQTGAHGFVEIWSHLPYFRWLARATLRMGLVTPLDALYRHFARWRARRRCNEDLCTNQRDEA